MNMPNLSQFMNRVQNAAAPIAHGAGMLGIGALAVGEVAHEARKAIDIHNTEKKLIEVNPELAQYDPKKVKDYFDVVKLYSPQAARNPLVAGALVNKMIQFGGVDHKLVQDMANINTGDRDLGGHLANMMKYKPIGADTEYGYDERPNELNELRAENKELHDHLSGSGRMVDQMVQHGYGV